MRSGIRIVFGGDDMNRMIRTLYRKFLTTILLTIRFLNCKWFHGNLTEPRNSISFKNYSAGKNPRSVRNFPLET